MGRARRSRSWLLARAGIKPPTTIRVGEIWPYRNVELVVAEIKRCVDGPEGLKVDRHLHGEPSVRGKKETHE